MEDKKSYFERLKNLESKLKLLEDDFKELNDFSKTIDRCINQITAKHGPTLVESGMDFDLFLVELRNYFWYIYKQAKKTSE
jgi:predicted P-loop ATPase/GTPase